MVEMDAFNRQHLFNQPGLPGGFQHVKRANDIRLYKTFWIVDRTIYMRLSRKMDDRVDGMAVKQITDQLLVANAAVNKYVALRIGQILQIVHVAGIRQGIQVDDKNIWL